MCKLDTNAETETDKAYKTEVLYGTEITKNNIAVELYNASALDVKRELGENETLKVTLKDKAGNVIDKINTETLDKQEIIVEIEVTEADAGSR